MTPRLQEPNLINQAFSLRGLIARVEKVDANWHYMGLTTFGVILLRIALDNLVYKGNPSITEGVYLLHIPTFYFCLFLAIAIVVGVSTNFSMKNPLKIVLCLSPVILFPPIIDLMIYGIQTRSITYLPQSASSVKGFLVATFCLSEHENISLGQRLVVHAVAIMCSFFAFIKTKNLITSLLCWITILLIIFTFAVTPLTVASFLANIFSSDAMIGMQRYEKLFNDRLSFLAAQEHSEAAIFLILIPFLLISLEFLRDRKSAAALVRNSRILRALHYILFMAIGLIMSVKTLYKGNSPLAHPFDFLGIAMLFESVFFAFESAVWLNDIADVGGDRLSNLDRPLVRGIVSIKYAYMVAVIMAVLSVMCAATLGPHITFLILLAQLLAYMYSMPPFRLKKWFPLSSCVIGTISLIVAQSGYSLIAGQGEHFLPLHFSLGLFLSVALISTFKDLKDKSGDLKSGVLTIMTIFEYKKALAITCLTVFCGGIILATTLLGFLWGSLLGAPLGIVAAILLLKSVRNEKIILFVYILGLIGAILLLTTVL